MQRLSVRLGVNIYIREKTQNEIVFVSDVIMKIVNTHEGERKSNEHSDSLSDESEASLM